MRLSVNSKVRRSDKVVSHEFEGVSYILDPKKNTVRILNKPAGVIWSSIEKRKTVSAVVDKLLRLFKVSRKKAENDVLEYLSKLIRLKYIKYD